MSMTMLPTGSSIGRSAPIAAAIGCSISCASAAPARRAASVTARRSTSVIADGTQMTTFGRLKRRDADALQQQPDHPLGDVEVGDRTAAQRPHGDDVAGRAPDHLPRLAAGRQHLAGLPVEGDHRRLVEHDAAALHVHERVRGAEVDRQVTGQRESPLAVAVAGVPHAIDRHRGGHRTTARRCGGGSSPMPSGGRPGSTPTARDDHRDDERRRRAHHRHDDEPTPSGRSPRPARRVDERAARRAPIRAVVPHLVLPDRHARLQRVDRRTGRLRTPPAGAARTRRRARTTRRARAGRARWSSATRPVAGQRVRDLGDDGLAAWARPAPRTPRT